MARYFAIFAVLIAALPASAQDGVKKVTSVEGITEFRLSNGMPVLLFPDDSKPTVTVNMTIFVGSRHEGYGEAGMAHLLEHMLFKGTPTFEDIPKELKDRGAQFNGTTSLDRTNYYETMPATDDNLEFGIKLEADRMINSYVKGADLKSEMTVVRNEFERGENSPIRVLMQRMTGAAFEWHNYGKTTIGNRADIERVPVENLKRFYQKFYQPDNAMLVVAGKFDPAKALEFAEKYLGTLPKPKRELDKTYTEEPAQDGERLVTVRRVGDVGVAGAIYHVPSGAHPDYPAISVLAQIMSTEPSGRLYQALVKTKRAAFAGGFGRAQRDPGMLMFLSQPAQGVDPPDVLETLLDTAERISENPIKDEEVKRSKREMLNAREQQSTNTTALATGLSEWAAQGDWRLYFLYRDRLEKVTTADVQRVAEQYLVRNNRTAGLFVPAKKAERISVPATPELAKMIGDYKGRKEIAKGEAFDPNPAAIEARTKRSTMPTGIKVAMLPRKTRGNQVMLQLSLRYGSKETLMGRLKAAELMPALMMRGTESMDRQKLQDELAKLNAQVQTGGTAGVLTVTIRTKRDQLPKTLSIVKSILREPKFADAELAIMKEEQVAGFRSNLSEPMRLAPNAVTRQLSIYKKGDPRYIATMEEEIEATNKVTSSDVANLYNDLLNGKNGEITIIGDFDQELVMDELEGILADWNSDIPYERLTKEARLDQAADYKEILTPDKANSMYFAAIPLALRTDHPDYPALIVGNTILGGGALSNRLGNRVRQQDGLSYTVASQLQLSELDQRGAFVFYAIQNPGNAGKVKAAILEEITKLLKDGVSDEEVANAKKAYLEGEQVNRTKDPYVMRLLSTSMQTGRTMKFVERMEEKLKSITKSDVEGALRKHLDVDKLFVVIAGDLKKE